MYVYLVVILALFAVAFFSFLLATGVQKVQEVFNPQLGEDQWLTDDHYTAFSYGATFVNNLWLLAPAILIFGLALWGYNYSQRRNGGA